jgi:hypothetical protein
MVGDTAQTASHDNASASMHEEAVVV